MPLFVEDIARASLAAIDTDAGLLRCVRFVSERYRELTGRARFRHLRRVGELNLPAPVTDGLATVARDSNLVTGDSTASPTWTTALIGRHFRQSVTWYEIVDVRPSATAAVLVLASAYAENPETTQPASYRIVQRHTPLASDVRYLGAFVHMRRRRTMRTLSLAELDMIYPSRHNITGGPRNVTEIGVDAQGRKIVELYPYNDLSEQIRYVYWPKSRDVKVNDTLPDEIDLVHLKAGVLVDLMRYEAARAARLGLMDKAGFYRNEYRAQTQEWERMILDAIRADKGLDDTTFILTKGGAAGPMDGDLVTDAHDSVLFNWRQ